MADGGQRPRSFSESTIFPPKCPRGVLGGNTADARTPNTAKVTLDNFGKISQNVCCDVATQYEPMINVSLISTTVLCDASTQTDSINFCDMCDSCSQSEVISQSVSLNEGKNLCDNQDSVSNISDCHKLIRSFSCTVSKLEERITAVNTILDSHQVLLSKLSVSTSDFNNETCLEQNIANNSTHNTPTTLSLIHI